MPEQLSLRKIAEATLPLSSYAIEQHLVRLRRWAKIRALSSSEGTKGQGKLAMFDELDLYIAATLTVAYEVGVAEKGLTELAMMPRLWHTFSGKTLFDGWDFAAVWPDKNKPSGFDATFCKSAALSRIIETRSCVALVNLNQVKETIDDFFKRGPH